MIGVIATGVANCALLDFALNFGPGDPFLSVAKGFGGTSGGISIASMSIGPVSTFKAGRGTLGLSIGDRGFPPEAGSMSDFEGSTGT
jgi:hypothetical protein